MTVFPALLGALVGLAGAGALMAHMFGHTRRPATLPARTTKENNR